eukprot:TRINITY_DN6488_c0_g1_i4.p2 TRINITY_DN6488_c0_g1~~TRINITY_DN6488_c0_g1_i4.p2  ORF type:complete len:616 (-),score=106.66 TRINITY_DN6488_c0_g1_i4:2611-4458(-)
MALSRTKTACRQWVHETIRISERTASYIGSADSSAGPYLIYTQRLIIASAGMMPFAVLMGVLYAFPSQQFVNVFGISIVSGVTTGFASTTAGVVDWPELHWLALLPVVALSAGIMVVLLVLTFRVARESIDSFEVNTGTDTLIVTGIDEAELPEPTAIVLERIALRSVTGFQLLHVEGQRQRIMFVFDALIDINAVRKQLAVEYPALKVREGPLLHHMKPSLIPFYTRNRLRRLVVRVVLLVIILVASLLLAVVYIVRVYLASPVNAFDANEKFGFLATLLSLVPTLGVTLASRGLQSYVEWTHPFERHATKQGAQKALFIKHLVTIFMTIFLVPISVFLVFSVLLQQPSFSVAGFVVKQSDFPNLLGGVVMVTFCLIAGEYMFSLALNVAVTAPALDLMRLPVLARVLLRRCGHAVPKKYRRYSTMSDLSTDSARSSLSLSSRARFSRGAGLMESLVHVVKPDGADQARDSASKTPFPFALRYAQFNVVFVTAVSLGFVFPLLLAVSPLMLTAMHLYDRYVLSTFAKKPIQRSRFMENTSTGFVEVVCFACYLFQAYFVVFLTAVRSSPLQWIDHSFLIAVVLAHVGAFAVLLVRGWKARLSKLPPPQELVDEL